MRISFYRSYCLNMQGYQALGDESKRAIDLAQRLKPGICGALTVVSLISRSAWVVLGVALLAYWAAFLPGHPADIVYRVVLRPLLGGPALPRDPAPRRFACGFVGTMLLAGAAGFALGVPLLGSLLVGMTATALLVLVVADFCLGSFFYWLLVQRRVFTNR